MLIHIQCVSDHRHIQSPLLVSGASLIDILSQGPLVLARLQGLRHGGVHRTYRRVEPWDTYDLSQYAEVYSRQQRLIGLIMVQDASTNVRTEEKSLCSAA